MACPQCAQPMTLMGKRFRAPKRADLGQWKKVELLASQGIVFHGWDGSRPASLSEVPEFLEVRAMARRGPGEVLADEIQGRSTSPRAVARQVKAEIVDGRTLYTLAGRSLIQGDPLEVKVNRKWVSGTFRTTGDGGVRVEPFVRTASGSVVPLKPQTACRWPGHP